MRQYAVVGAALGYAISAIISKKLVEPAKDVADERNNACIIIGNYSFWLDLW